MSKTKNEKQVNNIIKNFNRSLKKDVFGNRFEIRQVEKQRYGEMNYFLYKMIDNLEPERNCLLHRWLNVNNIQYQLFDEINDFIVRSDFWALYHNKPESYNKELDIYRR